MIRRVLAYSPTPSTRMPIYSPWNGQKLTNRLNSSKTLSLVLLYSSILTRTIIYNTKVATYIIKDCGNATTSHPYTATFGHIVAPLLECYITAIPIVDRKQVHPIIQSNVLPLGAFRFGHNEALHSIRGFRHPENRQNHHF